MAKKTKAKAKSKPKAKSKAKPKAKAKVKAKAKIKAAAKPKAKAKVVAKPVVKAKRAPNPAFMRQLTPSESLARVVGGAPLARTEVVKRLWAYIKQNNLQDPVERRNIRADDNLKPVFGGKDVVNMFEMTKLVNQHLS